MKTLPLSLPFYLNELAGHFGMWGNTVLFLVTLMFTMAGD